jgi:hypothetical protein
MNVASFRNHNFHVRDPYDVDSGHRAHGDPATRHSGGPSLSEETSAGNASRPHRGDTILELEALTDRVIEKCFGIGPFLEIVYNAQRALDVCHSCQEHLAHFNCSACDCRACNACGITSVILPYSMFCSESCRDEAELAAENARQS